MKKLTIPEKYRVDADPDVRKMRAEIAKLPSIDALRRAFVDAEAALTAAEEALTDTEVAARVGKATPDQEAAARDAVERAREAVGAAKKELNIGDRQRTALHAMLTQAENEATSRIASQIAAQITEKATALDQALASAATAQQELNALRVAADQFRDATLHGFAVYRAFPQARYGNILFVASAFRDVLTDDDSLLARWRKERAA